MSQTIFYFFRCGIWEVDTIALGSLLDMERFLKVRVWLVIQQVLNTFPVGCQEEEFTSSCCA